MGRLEKNTGRAGAAFSKLQNIIVGAVAAVGAFKLSKNFLDTAVEVENLAIQMKFLTGSAEEGAKAFDTLTDFAAGVPFQLQGIANSAPLLLTVTDGADELNQMLKITGDIAAATGLDFKTTAEQLQRALSGGIAAADLFREKGVKSLLGFQEGVRYTAEQTRQHIIGAFEDGTAVMLGASAEMANTWTGTMSMIGDKWFKFKVALMDAGPFDFVKGAMKLVDEALTKNFGSIEEAAEAIGNKMVEMAEKALIGGARIIDAMAPVVRWIGDSIGELIKTTNQLPAVIKALGIFGFLALGIKGKALVVTIGAALKPIKGMFAEIFELQAKATRIARDYTPFLTEERKKIMTQNIEEMMTAAKKLRGEMDELEGEEPDDTQFNVPKFYDAEADIAELGKYEAAVVGLLSKVKDATLQSELELHKDKIQIIAAGIESEKAAKRIAEKTAADEALANQERLHKLMLMKKNTFHQLVKQAEEKEAKRLQFIAEQTHKRKMEFHRLEAEGVKKFNEENISALEAFTQGFKGQMDQQKSVLEQLRDVGANTYDRMADALTNFVMTGKFNFKQFANSIIADLMRIYVKQLMIFALKKIAGSFLPFPIPGFADGGAISRGQPAIIGEEGPELFVPNASGTIIPNNQLSEGVGQTAGNRRPVQVVFNVNAIDSNSFQDTLAEQRDTIVGIINDALTDKGRPAIA